MSKSLQGIYAVTVTPFTKDGDFDFPAAKAHIDWLLSKGITGFCILGATGEYQSVTLEEHKAYVREILPYIGKRASVVVGASRERPDDVIELMQNAKRYGADAGMVLPSFYYHMTQDEIVDHYAYIAENADLPLLLYNNIGSAGVDIAPETYTKLFSLPNVAGVKESSGDIARLTDAVLQAPTDFSVVCGCDTLAYESFACGADAWISMAANFAPVDCIRLYEAVAVEKDYAKGMAIYRRLLPALRMLESFPKTAQAIKFALKETAGIDAGYVRRPRRELNEEERAYVRAQMQAETLQ